MQRSDAQHHRAPRAGAETIVTLSGLYERVLEIQPNTALKTVILADIPDSKRTARFRCVAAHPR